MDDLLYFKIINDSNCWTQKHPNNFQYYYQEGLNVCPDWLDDDPFCMKNQWSCGFSICTKDTVDVYYGFGQNLYVVELPHGSTISSSKFDVNLPKCRTVDKFAANSIILKKKYPLSDIETYHTLGLEPPDPDVCIQYHYFGLLQYFIDHEIYDINDIVERCLKYYRLKMLRFVVKNYANQINSDNNYLLLAIGYGVDIDTFKFLADYLGISNIEECLNDSVLYGEIDITKYLLENGADIGSIHQETLSNCAKNGHIKMIKYLAEIGVDIKVYVNDALTSALSSGNLVMIKFFVDNGADIDKNNTALKKALIYGGLETVRYLVSLGIDLGEYVEDAFRDACWRGSMDEVKLFVQMGVDIRADDDEALKIACEKNRLSVVKYLVQLGADVNSTESGALTIACTIGYLDLTKYLISIGVDIHAGNDRPLRRACKNGHIHVVEYLVQCGANIHATNNRALAEAKEKNYTRLVEYLVSLGASLDNN